MSLDAGTLAAVTIATVTLIGGLVGGLRFMIIHYLNELKPNSGSSLRDAVNRLEARVDELFTIIVEKL